MHEVKYAKLIVANVGEALSYEQRNGSFSWSQSGGRFAAATADVSDLLLTREGRILGNAYYTRVIATTVLARLFPEGGVVNCCSIGMLCTHLNLLRFRLTSLKRMVAG